MNNMDCIYRKPIIDEGGKELYVMYNFNANYEEVKNGSLEPFENLSDEIKTAWKICFQTAKYGK